MAKKERFLVFDIGSTALHMAEFESGNGLSLFAFDNIEYSEPLTDKNRVEVISEAISIGLATGKYQSRRAAICLSGQSAFMRFVKLPPITDDEESVKKVVEHEAKQNVPFPIEEVVWDYQLIGHGADSDELEVMFSVIKNDIVDSVIEAVSINKVKVIKVDFAPAALYNAARANYVGEDECSMLLNIGGKCTTLIFIEGNRFFARSIPIAGAQITQQIAKEFSITTQEAEDLKRRFGFVALGGAYEEPESEVAATISKIIRNVMTRLHGEINRTINIYRAQQKGSKPSKLLLAGGSSTMEFTVHFFSEKLRIAVDYLNAFPIVKVQQDKEDLAKIAHLFPETIGTALNQCLPCPVEIDLIPIKDAGTQKVKETVPFVFASCLILLICLGFYWWVKEHQAKNILEQCEKGEQKIRLQSKRKKKIDTQVKEVKNYSKKIEEVKALLQSRYDWTSLYNAIQAAKPIDIWVTKITRLDKDGKEFGINEFADVDSLERLRIHCFQVEIKESYSTDSGKKFVRPIFTEDQKNQLMIEIQKRFKNNRDKEKELFNTRNVITDDNSLYKFFERALQFNEKIKLCTAGGFSLTSVGNLKRFHLTIELDKPIVMKR